MKWKDLLERWGMTSLKLSVGVLETEWQPSDPDRDAAWDLYVELLTRVTTQPLSDRAGVEAVALESVHSLFPTTRAILREHGRQCVQFTKLAVVVLNQIVRPFTDKWHPISLQGGFSDDATRSEFRRELDALKESLVAYARALADIAGVEDLTGLARKA
jgi:hypothetical protein